MDIYSSYLYSECTDAEIEELDADEEFQRLLKVRQKTEERKLLEKLDMTIDIASSKGNANPLIWKLGVLNDKYNRVGAKKETPVDLKNAIIISSPNEINSREELATYDNVEVYGASDE